MKKINLLIIAVVLCCAAAENVSAQGIPGGSYTQSCKNIKVIDNVTITATCTGIQGGLLGLGGIVDYDAKLTNYFSCDGDISNNDGVLCCKRNLDTPRFKAAINAFKIVTARVAGPAAVFYAYTKGDIDAEIQYWLIEYFKKGFGANYTAALTAGSPGVSTTVEEYIRAHTELHESMVDNAFGEVYKRDAQSGELSVWTDKIASGQDYASMVSELKKKKAAEDKITKDKGTLDN